MSDSPVLDGPTPGTNPAGSPSTRSTRSSSPTRASTPPGPRRWSARRPGIVVALVVLMGTTLGVVLTTGNAQANPRGFLAQFSNVVPGPSTVPTNGDVNPYGIVVVPWSTGNLVQGGVLVSNFNDAANAQGTGTTIVQEMPDGTVTQFAQITQASTTGPCPGGIGLTTALSVLPGGWVVVGSLPTTASGPGNAGTTQGIGAGCLLVLNSTGQLVETWAGGAINGPWDMTSTTVGDSAYLFVTNVLNGTVAADSGIPSDQPGNVAMGGTVVRIRVGLAPGQNPVMQSQTVVASGFAERTDPNALVIGPTGVALGWNGTLYVADSVNNRIAAVPDALWRHSTFGVPGGLTVSDAAVLDDPLGMVLAPNGNILTVNGNNGLIVETSPWGQTVDTATLDDSGPAPGGAGDLFGLALVPGGRGVWFVDDGTNTLNVFF
jgi:NHL repeat